MENNKKVMTNEFNRAREYGIKFQLTKVLPYCIFIINKLFTLKKK